MTTAPNLVVTGDAVLARKLRDTGRFPTVFDVASATGLRELSRSGEVRQPAAFLFTPGFDEDIPETRVPDLANGLAASGFTVLVHGFFTDRGDRFDEGVVASARQMSLSDLLAALGAAPPAGPAFPGPASEPDLQPEPPPEPWEPAETREPTETPEFHEALRGPQEAPESGEAREPRPVQEPQGTREPQETRESQAIQESQGVQESLDPREPREPRETWEPWEGWGPQESPPGYGEPEAPPVAQTVLDLTPGGGLDLTPGGDGETRPEPDPVSRPQPGPEPDHAVWTQPAPEPDHAVWPQIPPAPAAAPAARGPRDRNRKPVLLVLVAFVVIAVGIGAAGLIGGDWSDEGRPQARSAPESSAPEPPAPAEPSQPSRPPSSQAAPPPAPKSPEVPTSTPTAVRPVRQYTPGALRIADNRISIEVSWQDRSGGRASHYVVGGPTGHPPSTLASTPPGTTKVVVTALNPGVDYCLTVVAVVDVDRVAQAKPVCTHRVKRSG